MKLNKSVLIAFILLIIVGSVFRVMGFAPQIAMAVFGAAVIKDKRLAIIVPLLSMLVSDVLYEALYQYGYMAYGGFYTGQITNYILIAATSIFGFWAKSLKPSKIVLATLAAPTVYFLASNFLLWANGGGLQRPKTFAGMLMCYTDALPFFKSSLIATSVFSVLLFGSYFLIKSMVMSKKREAVA